MGDEFRVKFAGEVDPTAFLEAMGEEAAKPPKPPVQKEGVEVSHGSDKLVEAFREFLKAGEKVLGLLEQRSTR